MEVHVDDMIVKSMTDAEHDQDLRKMFDMKLNLKKCVFGVRSGKFLGFMINSRMIEANLDKIQAILDMNPPRIIKEVQ